MKIAEVLQEIEESDLEILIMNDYNNELLENYADGHLVEVKFGFDYWMRILVEPKTEKVLNFCLSDESWNELMLSFYHWPKGEKTHFSNQLYCNDNLQSQNSFIISTTDTEFKTEEWPLVLYIIKRSCMI